MDTALKASGDETRSIIVSRDIAAPRPLVFKAWTDPRHIAHWWGPNGFTTTTLRFEFRAGGVWRFVMHGPDGRDYQNRVTFTEITPPARIVYDHGGGEGDLEPITFRSTVTFAEVGRKTRVTLNLVFPSAAERDLVAHKYGAVEGGHQTLARLDAYVQKSPSWEDK